MKGLKNLQSKLTDWEDSRVKALEKIIKETGRAIRKDARRRAPRNTGRLRKSIQFKFVKSKRRNELYGAVRAVARYSHVVETGSVARNIKPQPFIRPAVEAAKAEYLLKLEYVMGNV
jgi:HK97 gp10 family phage protein